MSERFFYMAGHRHRSAIAIVTTKHYSLCGVSVKLFSCVVWIDFPYASVVMFSPLGILV